MSMRYAWTVAGDDPDLAEGDRHGITGYFYPMLDPLTTTAEVQRAASWGGGRAVGIYWGHNWEEGLLSPGTPGQIATVIRNEYRRVTKNGTVLPQLRVMYNEEDHDPAKILAVLKLLREGGEGFGPGLPKNTGLSWSPEGMQGGWIGPIVTATQGPSAFVAELIRLKVRVVPQSFWGAGGTIQGDWALDQVLRDLTRRGIPESSISLFLDGKTLDSKRNAEGYVFTMGRLPWLG